MASAAFVSDISNDTDPLSVCPFPGSEKVKENPARAPVACVNFVSVLSLIQIPVLEVKDPELFGLMLATSNAGFRAGVCDAPAMAASAIMTASAYGFIFSPKYRDKSLTPQCDS